MEADGTGESPESAIDFTQMLPELAIELNRRGEILLVLPENFGAQAMVQAVKTGFEKTYRRMFGDSPVLHTFCKDGTDLVMVYHRPEAVLAS
ncbi:MAG TPA: hypothetical protein PKV72_02615 [Candidatus Peribacteria bacterium]|nr:hypothetical protein [Candidatus Peribacteria bacterium]